MRENKLKYSETVLDIVDMMVLAHRKKKSIPSVRTVEAVGTSYHIGVSVELHLRGKQNFTIM